MSSASLGELIILLLRGMETFASASPCDWKKKKSKLITPEQLELFQRGYSGGILQGSWRECHWTWVPVIFFFFLVFFKLDLFKARSLRKSGFQLEFLLLREYIKCL